MQSAMGADLTTRETVVGNKTRETVVGNKTFDGHTTLRAPQPAARGEA